MYLFVPYRDYDVHGDDDCDPYFKMLILDMKHKSLIKKMKKLINQRKLLWLSMIFAVQNRFRLVN